MVLNQELVCESAHSKAQSCPNDPLRTQSCAVINTLLKERQALLVILQIADDDGGLNMSDAQMVTLIWSRVSP